MKEVYFLAKDPQSDRMLMHKVVIGDDNNPEAIGYCATIPNDPESDYVQVMKVVSAYTDGFGRDLHGQRFYEGFALWAMDYFEKHNVPIGTPALELETIVPGKGLVRRYTWKREGLKIKRVEL